MFGDYFCCGCEEAVGGLNDGVVDVGASEASSIWGVICGIDAAVC